MTSGFRVKRVLIWGDFEVDERHCDPSMKRRMKTLSREDGLQIERGTVFLRDVCHREINQRNFLDKRLPREACFDLGDVKVEKDIVIFIEEEGEDILVEEGLQIERGTVFHRDRCHREILPRNIRDKRFPREACFELGGVKVEKDIVTFNEEEDEDILVEEGPQIERGTVFLKVTCHREID